MTESNNELLLSTLPPILRAIISALGLVRAQDLLIEHGGCYIKIPRKNAALLGLSDEELAALRIALDRHMGNDDRVALPKIDKIFMLFRDVEIRTNKSRYTLNELAKMYRLTSRHIQNICRDEGNVTANQDDLFGGV